MCVPPAKNGASQPTDQQGSPSEESFARWLSRIAAGVVTAPLTFVWAGVGDRIIWGVLGRDYIYNVSWEDPRVDRNELKLSETDHVVTLASAGDNALDYVIEGAKVSAVDFNPCQIALCELKVAIIKELAWEDAFAILARSDIALLRKYYYHGSPLREQLRPESQKFWDGRVDKDFNFMYSGTSGAVAWAVMRVLAPLLGLGFLRRFLHAGVSKEEFVKEVLKRHYRIKFFFKVIVKAVSPLLFPFIGVPASQASLGDGDDIFLGIANKVLLETDMVNDNYFYSGYILGYYKEYNCPRYLMKEHFGTLKENLKAGKLVLFCGTLEQYVRGNPGVTFTVASLLDHMDWMTHQDVNNELAFLLPSMDPERGRLYWRSFGSTVTSSTPSVVWMGPKPVDCTGDRVHCYFSTWVVHLKDTKYTMAPRCVSWQGGSEGFQGSILEKIVVGLQLVTYPALKKLGLASAPQAAPASGNGAPGQSSEALAAHSREMDAFYAKQKDGYDLFRENLLPGRRCMANLLPTVKPAEGNKMVWVDVGGGTARNLEFFALPTLRQFFRQIYIVDVSRSLLEIARARVEAAGLSDIVKIVQQDITAVDAVEELCGAHQADLVTFSYSLSMIPKQSVALEAASRLLKPAGAGTLAVADFFLSGGKKDDALRGLWWAARWLEMTAQKLWFKQDAVHLLDENTLALVEGKGTKTLDTRSRHGVPFLPLLRPYHGVVMVPSA
eukprot:g5766.t1